MKQEVLAPDAPIPMSVALPKLKKLHSGHQFGYLLILSGGSRWLLRNEVLFNITGKLQLDPQTIDWLFQERLLEST